MLFFFYKQKTAYEVRISDCSSDVCSSDLLEDAEPRARQQVPVPAQHGGDAARADAEQLETAAGRTHASDSLAAASRATASCAAPAALPRLRAISRKTSSRLRRP